MDPNYLSVTIRNRDGLLYQGECISLTSYNKLGKFDVLSTHANFISLIEKEVILRTKNEGERKIAVNNGVCKVKENIVTIFLGIRKEV